MTVQDASPLVTTLVSSHDISISSSSSLPTTSSLEFENQFGISNTDDLEFLNFCHPCTTVASSCSAHNFTMESECNDNATGMKVDPDPPNFQDSSQDGIMKVLMAISSQMMVNTKDLHDKITKNALDLQHQLVRNDFKLTQEIQ
jgi:hypothetical protein